VAPGSWQGAGALDDAHELADDLGPSAEDDLDDLDDAWEPPPRRPRWERRWVALAVLGAAAVLTGGVVTASSALRTPQERLEDRLTEAVLSSGAQLAAPVELSPGTGDGRPAEVVEDGADVVWTGRVQVVEADGTATVRVALRLPPSEPDEVVPALFPAVDCDSPYPLTWPGDSDTSYRTTRDDLSECVATADGDAVLVTIGWRDDDERGDDGSGGGGRPGVDRQTWRTDGGGALVWLRSRGPGDGGLTGEQQRAVASAEGLLARL